MFGRRRAAPPAVPPRRGVAAASARTPGLFTPPAAGAAGATVPAGNIDTQHYIGPWNARDRYSTAGADILDRIVTQYQASRDSPAMIHDILDELEQLPGVPAPGAAKNAVEAVRIARLRMREANGDDAAVNDAGNAVGAIGTSIADRIAALIATDDYTDPATQPVQKQDMLRQLLTGINTSVGNTALPGLPGGRDVIGAAFVDAMEPFAVAIRAAIGGADVAAITDALNTAGARLNDMITEYNNAQVPNGAKPMAATALNAALDILSATRRRITMAGPAAPPAPVINAYTGAFTEAALRGLIDAFFPDPAAPAPAAGGTPPSTIKGQIDIYNGATTTDAGRRGAQAVATRLATQINTSANAIITASGVTNPNRFMIQVNGGPFAPVAPGAPVTSTYRGGRRRARKTHRKAHRKNRKTGRRHRK